MTIRTVVFDEMVHGAWLKDGRPITWEEWDLEHLDGRNGIQFSPEEWRQASEGEPMTLAEYDAALQLRTSNPGMPARDIFTLIEQEGIVE